MCTEPGGATYETFPSIKYGAFNGAPQTFSVGDIVRSCQQYCCRIERIRRATSCPPGQHIVTEIFLREIPHSSAAEMPDVREIPRHPAVEFVWHFCLTRSVRERTPRGFYKKASDAH